MIFHGMAFSPADSRLLAVGYGHDGVSYVSLWDIDAGIELARLPAATDLPGFKVDDFTGGLRAGIFAGWEISRRWIRRKAYYNAKEISQSLEGVGSGHAPTDPRPHWTLGLLYCSGLLAGR